MEKKELKGCLKMMIGMIVISYIILYCTCFFNGYNLMQAAQMKETSFFVWGALLPSSWGILSLVVMLVTERIKLPSVPGGSWKKEELVVCKYNRHACCAIFSVCLILSLLLLGGAITNFRSGMTVGGFALVCCGLIMLVPGIAFWFCMTRYVLIFYPDGLVYRDLRGNVYHITDQEVQYVCHMGYGKYRSFKLKTEERCIILGVQARNFYEAESYAIKRYSVMDAEK